MGDNENNSTHRTCPVVTATITPGHVRAEFMASTMQASAERVIQSAILQSSGPYLDMGRNLCVKKFLLDEFADAEFLLFVDSDIAYTPDDVRNLVDATYRYHDEYNVWPLTGGTYQGVTGGQRTVIAYRWSEPDPDTGEKLFISVPVDEIQDIPARTAGLLPVDAFGTGFMLIHRTILDEFPKHFAAPQPWFAEIPVDGTWFGEDLIFCMRAASIGFPVLLHTGVRLAHYKDIGLVF